MNAPGASALKAALLMGTLAGLALAATDSASQPTPASRPATSAATSRSAGRDNILVEDLAMAMLVAIRDKDDASLKALATDRIKGWTDALPHFAVEMRERFRQLTGKEFQMYPGQSLVRGDLAAVKCDGPAELKGVYLVLLFVRTDAGWRNFSLHNSPASESLASHLDAAVRAASSRSTTGVSAPSSGRGKS